jgi:hypothetical protein
MDWKLFRWKLSNLRHLLRGLPDMIMGLVRPVGRLYVTVMRVDGSTETHGLVSTRVVTTAGVNFLVDAFQGTTEPEAFKYHGMGTGAVAENVSDTALGTEVETRATGTQVEGASANIYRTVGTITATAPRVVTEHGVFSASTTGTLLDRSVFSAINLANGDSIQFTYELTLPAGS